VTTKRTPLNRHSRTRITPAAVALFVTAEKHAARYAECVAGQRCHSQNGGREHCAECRAFLEAHAALDRALGLKPWEASPLHVQGDGPWREDGTAWAASLPQAAALRKDLEQLAGTGGRSKEV
jgi:hypothetical protein